MVGEVNQESMINFNTGLRVYLCSKPVDMRKSFNGLYQIVENRLKDDPRNGSLFVFINKNKSRLKGLYFDGTGLWVMAKRLEKGTFSWPKSTSGKDKLLLSSDALQLLLSGIDMKDYCRKAWYEG